MRNTHKKVKEIVALFFVFLIFTLIFYWRIFGFKPVDDFLDKAQKEYPLFFYTVLFTIFVSFMHLSWKEYKKGDDFELFRVVFYGFSIVVILLALTLVIL